MYGRVTNDTVVWQIVFLFYMSPQSSSVPLVNFPLLAFLIYIYIVFFFSHSYHHTLSLAPSPALASIVQSLPHHFLPHLSHPTTPDLFHLICRSYQPPHLSSLRTPACPSITPPHLSSSPIILPNLTCQLSSSYIFHLYRLRSPVLSPVPLFSF